MLFTTHALVGGVIGVATANPVFGFIGGVISHHLADWIPHFDGGSFYVGISAQADTSRTWNNRDWAIAIADLIIGSLISFILWQRHGFHLDYFFGALGGVFPDLVHVVPFWKDAVHATRLGKLYGDFHTWMHTTAPISQWYVGVTTNLALIAFSLIYLLRS